MVDLQVSCYGISIAAGQDLDHYSFLVHKHFICSNGSWVRAADVLGNLEGLQLGLYYQPPVGPQAASFHYCSILFHMCQDIWKYQEAFVLFFFFFACSYQEREFHQNVHFNSKSRIPCGTKKEDIMCKPEQSHKITQIYVYSMRMKWYFISISPPNLSSTVNYTSCIQKYF